MKVYLTLVGNFPKGIFSTPKKALDQLHTLYTEYVAHQQQIDESIVFEIEDVNDFGEVLEVELDSGELYNG